MSQTTKIIIYILNSRYPIYSYSDLTLGSIFYERVVKHWAGSLERGSMPQATCQCYRGVWTMPLTAFNFWSALRYSGSWTTCCGLVYSILQTRVLICIAKGKIWPFYISLKSHFICRSGNTGFSPPSENALDSNVCVYALKYSTWREGGVQLYAALHPALYWLFSLRHCPLSEAGANLQ